MVTNRLGSRSRKLIAQGLRFKRTLTEKALNVCPNVENIKVRVLDVDVAHLAELSKLVSAELLYQAGNLQSPALGTSDFLSRRGHQVKAHWFISMGQFHKLKSHKKTEVKNLKLLEEGTEDTTRIC